MGNESTSWFVSKYLNFYPCEESGRSLLFHGVVGSIDEVHSDLEAALRQARSSSQPVFENELSPSVFQHLVERGYLTRLTEAEEVEKFVDYAEQLHEIRRRVKSGYLMIIPSYECNLRCPYCFQNALRDSLGEDFGRMTVEQVRTLFDVTIPSTFGELSNSLSITLYGGEPFTHETAEANEAVIAYTRKRGHYVDAITNGTMVSEFPDFFGSELGKVNAVQVSLDGGPAEHNRSRIPTSGTPTFDRILENVAWLAERGVDVLLRVNVTPEAINSLPELERILLDNSLLSKSNVSAYCHAVHGVHTKSEDDVFPEIFSQSKLTARMKQLKIKSITSPLDRTCSSTKSIFNSEGGIELTRTSFCMQNRPAAYIFDPYFDVYGCYDEAGYREKRIGEINNNGLVVLNDHYEILQSRTVFSHEPCRSCSVALTCGGGCPAQAEVENGTIFSSFCDSHKALVAESMIKLHSEHKSGSLEVESTDLKNRRDEIAPLA